MSSILANAGMHGFFGSDAWSSFGVRAVEWAMGRILNHLQDTAPVKQNISEDKSNRKALGTPDK